MNRSLFRLAQALVSLGHLLTKLQQLAVRLGPSRVFNIMKMPQLLAVLLRVVQSAGGAVLFLTLWAILAFWVPRYGRIFFWVSIALQLLFIGLPEFLLTVGWVQETRIASLAIVQKFSQTWPLWIFVAGLILEIVDWFKPITPGRAQF